MPEKKKKKTCFVREPIGWHGFSMGGMPFLKQPNQQRQSTEGNTGSTVSM